MSAVSRRLDRHEAACAHEAPIRTLEELLPELARRRTTGATIVFTNGCFDLLHAGHVQLLEEARRLGDVLVVAVNSDASVRRLKGPTRPVVREAERAAMLASLACVDFVVIFDEDTPHRLLEAIRPDVLVKGGTYRAEEVVGREIVKPTAVAFVSPAASMASRRRSLWSPSAR